MRVLRWAGMVLLAVVGLIGLAALYVRVALPSVPPPAPLTVAVTPEKLARGAYLAQSVALCTDCHSRRDFTRFAAPLKPGTLGAGGEHFGHEYGFPGELVAPNITPFALGKWSDGELLQALTAGITPSKRALFPFMKWPAYAKLCRADLESIISYVRSLAPIDSTPPLTELDFPVSLIVRTLPKSEPLVETCPDPKDTLEYGAYLTNAAVCIDCHTQRDGPDMRMDLAYAGGVDFPIPGGNFVSRSKNITPDVTTGIGSWTRAAFIERFAAYRTPESAHATKPGEPNSIMPWTMYATMTDDDLGAIYQFLRTVKPVELDVGKLAKR